MKFFRHIFDIKNLKALQGGSVVTIGNYDGVHLGHKKVLSHLLAKSRELKLPSAVIIFEPQPEEFFHPQAAPARLLSLSEKLSAFRNLGVDYVLCLRFDEGLAELTAEKFIAKILNDGLHAKYIIIGEDFGFGREKKGSFLSLKKAASSFGFGVEIINDFTIGGIRVSATAIRTALERGDLALAEKYLARPYAITGRVVHGKKVGRDLGFPTANIALRCKVLPLSGVYLVKVYGLNGESYDGIANLGFRPTFAKLCFNRSKSLEVYLFDFDRDIYQKKIIVEFILKLRDEKKFSDPDLLRAQIEQDIARAKELIKSN